MKKTLLASLIALAIAACGGGNDTTPTVPAPQAAAAPAAVSADPTLFGQTIASAPFVKAEPQAPKAPLASVAPIHP